MIENVKIRQTPCIFFIIRRNPTKYPKSYFCRIIRQVTHTEYSCASNGNNVLIRDASIHGCGPPYGMYLRNYFILSLYTTDYIIRKKIFSRCIENSMDELAPASRNNVINEPSDGQSILRYFQSLIPIPCGMYLDTSISIIYHSTQPYQRMISG